MEKKKEIRPLRVCIHCKYLASSGGEYPEEYCSLGIEDNNPLVFADKNGNLGCIYTDRQLELMDDYISEQESHQYDGIADYMRGKEEIQRIENEETRPLDPFEIVSGLENLIIDLRNTNGEYWIPERVSEENKKVVLAAINYIKSREELMF